jgi:hypothetical protein
MVRQDVREKCPARNQLRAVLSALLPAVLPGDKLSAASSAWNDELRRASRCVATP